MEINKMFTEKKCPVCGKLVVRASYNNYTYKKNGEIYCGWNCYRKGTAKKEEK